MGGGDVGFYPNWGKGGSNLHPGASIHRLGLSLRMAGICIMWNKEMSRCCRDLSFAEGVIGSAGLHQISTRHGYLALLPLHTDNTSDKRTYTLRCLNPVRKPPSYGGRGCDTDTMSLSGLPRYPLHRRLMMQGRSIEDASQHPEESEIDSPALTTIDTLQANPASVRQSDINAPWDFPFHLTKIQSSPSQ
jgi:hypothetical protein